MRTRFSPERYVNLPPHLAAVQITELARSVRIYFQAEARPIDGLQGHPPAVAFTRRGLKTATVAAFVEGFLVARGWVSI